MARAEINLFGDLSTKALRGVAGRKRYFPWMALNSPAVIWEKDDFLGRTILAGEAVLESDDLASRYESVATGVSAVKAAIDANVVNGQVLLDPASADNGSTSLSLGRHFRADLGAFIVARLHINSSVATAKFEVGFTDSLADDGAILVKADPTYTADDAAILIYDTDHNAYVEGRSVDSTVAGPSITSTSNWIHGGGAFTPTADTFNYYGVFLTTTPIAGDADTEVSGVYKIAIWNADMKLLHESAWYGGGTLANSAITPSTLLTPWVYVQNRSAAQRSMDLDWWGYGQFRTTGS